MTFESLLGLKLRPRRMREATKLWEKITRECGIDKRDSLWSHPDLLPTLPESSENAKEDGSESNRENSSESASANNSEALGTSLGTSLGTNLGTNGSENWDAVFSKLLEEEERKKKKDDEN